MLQKRAMLLILLMNRIEKIDKIVWLVMAICKLMISDYLISSGQYDNNVCYYDNAELMISDYLISSGQYDNNVCYYDNADLVEGINYGEWLLEMGFKEEPFYDFNIKEFITWCKGKITKKRRHRHDGNT